jgi:hypothetical protein
MDGQRARAAKWFLSCLGSLLLASTPALGQATRTWVSGVGDDVNPCSRTAPCKTFAGAISKTATGGEISVLDPGGYGALTITKSITISGDGELASVLAAGISAIVVNVGPADVVILRDIEITGVGGQGVSGVRMIGSGDLHVDRVRIFGFSQWGIDAAINAGGGPPGTGRLFVNDSTFRDNASGAIYANPVSSSSMTGAINRVEMVGNGRGVVAYDGSNVSVDNSTISGCSFAGIVSYGANRYSDVALRNSSITGCGNGIFANNYARVRMSNVLVTNNTTGMQAAGVASIQSFGNNQVYGNMTDGAPTSMISPM